jgi:hypothetical protein
MCTLVILIRPGHGWPTIMAANRDEMRDRPWAAPARHWDDRPHVTAGHDELAGGTWLGMNDDGVVAGILNRINSLGPADDKRSRGELPLEALDHEDARTAAGALANLDPNAYRPFNMIIADADEAYCLINDGVSPHITSERIKPGVSMVTAHGMNDRASDRMAFHLPRFQAAPPPDPGEGDWFAWKALIADRSRAEGADWDGSMLIDDVEGYNFGTVSSSLIALPAKGRNDKKVHSCWLFAPGRPDTTDWREVLL